MGPADPLADRRFSVDHGETAAESLCTALFAGLPAVPGVRWTVETVTSEDGDEIALYIHQPAHRAEPPPGVLYLHGGGMVMWSTAGDCSSLRRDELAATGVLVVGVGFRDASGALGPFPFPARSIDCFAGLVWMSENRQRSGMSARVVHGESVGPDLARTTALLAARRSHLDLIDGVHAMAPLISGGYGWSDAGKAARYPSPLENDGYVLSCVSQDLLASVYDPQVAPAEDPLCWPSTAGSDDLRGCLPNVVSVIELDPLRDEGLAYYRALARAGVVARGRTVNGTCHVGDQLFRAAMPDVYAATIAGVHHVATTL